MLSYCYYIKVYALHDTLVKGPFYCIVDGSPYSGIGVENVKNNLEGSIKHRNRRGNVVKCNILYNWYLAFFTYAYQFLKRWGAA